MQKVMGFTTNLTAPTQRRQIAAIGVTISFLVAAPTHRVVASPNPNASASTQVSSAPASTAPVTAKTVGVDFAEDAVVNVIFPPWFKTSFLDLGEDLDEALAAGKQGILLFISATHCSYCKAFLDTALQDAEIRNRLTAGFDVVGLDIFHDIEVTTVDGRQYKVKDFVTLTGANYTPTLIFLGEGGRLLLRIVGYYPPERFRLVLDYLEAKEYLRQPFGDYVRASSVAPDTDGQPITADDLFEDPPYLLDRSVIPAQRPLLVLFERPECPACVRFHERVLRDKTIRGLIGRLDAVQLDATDAQGRVVTPEGRKTNPSDWYRDLELSYHPAVVFFDEKGNEVMRLDSETLRFRLEGLLQMALERAYENDAQLQRWRRAKALENIQ